MTPDHDLGAALDRLLAPLSEEARACLLPWLIFPLVEAMPEGAACPPSLRLYVAHFITLELGLTEKAEPAVMQQALTDHALRHPPDQSVLLAVAALLRDASAAGKTASIGPAVAKLIGHDASFTPVGSDSKTPEGAVRASPSARLELNRLGPGPKK